MKVLEQNEMAKVEAGFAWNSFASGALCAIGIITAETGAGLVLAGAACGAAFLPD